jgi:hypothetical protein
MTRVDELLPNTLESAIELNEGCGAHKRRSPPSMRFRRHGTSSASLARGSIKESLGEGLLAEIASTHLQASLTYTYEPHSSGLECVCVRCSLNGT